MSPQRILLLLATVSVFALSPCDAADENLLINPGFEKGDGKTECEGWDRSRNASHSLDPAKARTGKGAKAPSQALQRASQALQSEGKGGSAQPPSSRPPSSSYRSGMPAGSCR